VLRKLPEEVAECYRRAREAREQADCAADSAEELDYLAMERRWMMLAQSYELVERLADFSNEAKNRAAPLFSRQSDPAEILVSCPACGRQMRRTSALKPQAGPSADLTRFECETCDVTTLRTGRTTAD
jgi:hypothetical protein